MGGLFGGPSNPNNPTPIATTLRVQSSLQGRPRSRGWGQTRLAGNLIWYGDFRSVPGQSAGGKGGRGGVGSIFKGGNAQTDYFASVVVSVGEGPIAEILTIYNGNAIDFLVPPPAGILADLEALGIVPTNGNNTYNGTYLLGDYSQSPWSYLTAHFPSQALAYRGEALACFANLSLGSSPTLPNFNFEVLWGINSAIPALGPDANPADVVDDFLTNPHCGVPGFPAVLLESLDTYRTMCTAAGLVVSPALTDQTAANSFLGDLMDATIATFRWSGGLLDIVALAEQPITGNATTYTPDLTPLYTFGAGDYLPNQGGGSSSGNTPVTVKLTDPATINNKVQLEYLDRSNLYNPVTIYAQDDASIISSGRQRIGDLKSYHFFCLGSAAQTSLGMQLQRQQVAATYQWTVGRRYSLLEVGDYVALDEPRLGLQGTLVRLLEIQENSDQTRTMTAEQVFETVTASPGQSTQKSGGAARNQNAPASPVNTPVIYEPPTALLTGKNVTGSEVWVVASGGIAGVADPNWGGCFVWLSLDNATYQQIGVIDGPGRQGLLTATMAAAPTNPDLVNHIAVDMTESGGALASATTQAAGDGVTLCLAGAELMAYATATLTATNHYSLTGLQRGLYGTASASHGIADPFARLDETAFRYTLQPQFVGQTIYLKFQSFNITGGGLQDLADCVAYTYTPTGAATDHPVARAWLTGAPMDMGLAAGTAGVFDDFGTTDKTPAIFVDLGLAA